MNIPKIDLQPYLEIAKRRIFWIVIPFIGVLGLSYVFLQLSPKIYRATTLILVESQSVPEAYVESTVSESLQSRLNTITQQVNSRTNLENIIHQFDLKSTYTRQKSVLQQAKEKLLGLVRDSQASDGGAQGAEVSTFTLVKQLRSKTHVDLKGGHRGGTQAIEITVEWQDPDLAADIANAVASQLIERNLEVREQMATGTTQFLDSEVKRLRRELEQKEQELEDFRQKHMGTLPSELESNLQILNQNREELNNLQDRLTEEKQQVIALQQRLEDIQSMVAASASAAEDGDDGQGPADLPSLQQRLDQLQSKYTEKHPDIVSLKRRIAKLEEQQSATGGSTESNTLSMAAPQTREGREIQRQLRQARMNIESYKQQIQEVRNQIEIYKERVKKTPEIEMQLTKLRRDYQTVSSRYDEVLSRKLDAQMAEELEKSQKGEKFRILDKAVPPSSPFKPDIRKIMLMAVVLGLGSGGGLAYLKESFDPAFYTPEEVEAYLDAKVVVNLPIVEKKS